ncbi:transglutaminase-like putative cysteine protease [Sphaerotilus hippei]|uniref:Transglutaminase-like putative cysteine protease n=1 Tax=Sphaerotilus hippei TaxID=744406 RepID=A0A318H8R0_9BURK|nr:transglutaminase family protein [Sphaerotilus hippei]PXW99288.1 transglutaminase-like putative cysteine protease [Sphaerotilus hippei]
MVRIQLVIDLNYTVAPPGADFVFNIHCAHTRCQTVVSQQLHINQPVRPLVHTDPVTANRYLRLAAVPGPLQVLYTACVDIQQHFEWPDRLEEVPVAQLPTPVLNYIYPSRYCQSDRLGALATAEFGHLPKGYRRVIAIQNWVRQRVSFRQNTTNSHTSALDTLTDRVGVCRDFAHLMIALCRALSIPARFTTGIDYGADPALGPTDFHAYVEVYLSHRWYIVDPSGTAIPMGFVRLGVGRDAADVAFATIFGGVQSALPRLEVRAVTDDSGRWAVPQHRIEALSTDSGP